jgi:biotin carboxyl carrier protein
MKYKVRIDGRTFEAEVGNVDARPIVVMVEGERFEVWPEAGPVAESPPIEAEGARLGSGKAKPKAEGARVEPRRAEAAQVDRPGPGANRVRAPIPGVIDSIAVRAGDAVDVGDPLCVIEAMKMKNIIRASRGGTIDDVLVAQGQHVHHNDVLLEFAG